MPGTILIVDDDKKICDICDHFLKSAGYNTKPCYNGSDALTLAQQNDINVALLDINLPDMSGKELLQKLKALKSDIEVLMISAHGSIETAVECMKLGASDFIEKPFKKERVLSCVEKVLKVKGLSDELFRLQRELKQVYKFDNMIGVSKPMQSLYEKITMAFDNDSTVLITGESGTGKDLIARTIHYNSKFSSHPFIAVSCAALPQELIESELFGYKRGAFTGAVTDTLGIFRAANGGTVYLDEITEMPTSCQAKLLRVIQEKTVRPIGSTEELPVNVRIICSTNRDIETQTKKGQFREDLYYRISVIRINVPPLRERKEDIELLVHAFIDKYNKKLKKRVTGIDRDALSALFEHNWKGNVRELENVIESIFVMGRSNRITLQDLPQFRKTKMEHNIMSIDEAIQKAVWEALQHSKGNKSQAASILGTTRKRLYHLMKKYNIQDLK